MSTPLGLELVTSPPERALTVDEIQTVHNWSKIDRFLGHNMRAPADGDLRFEQELVLQDQHLAIASYHGGALLAFLVQSAEFAASTSFNRKSSHPCIGATISMSTTICSQVPPGAKVKAVSEVDVKAKGMLAFISTTLFWKGRKCAEAASVHKAFNLLKGARRKKAPATIENSERPEGQ